MEIGRMLIVLGVITLLLGMVLTFFGGFASLPKLPGDIFIKRGNFTFYFPIVTSIVISILLTLLLNLFFRK